MIRTCWLIRAGEESRHAQRFVDGRVVALGWPDVEGLADLRGLDRDAVRSALARDPRLNTPDRDADELLAFRDDIQLRDIIVTPDARTREVLLGEVLGDYCYRNPSPAADYRHVRDVRWFGRWERDLLPDALRRQTNYRRTIRRLDDQDVWLGIALRISAGEGRPPHARGRPGSDRTARPRTTPGATPRRTCPGCGLAKAFAQYTGGNDLCIDCR